MPLLGLKSRIFRPEFYVTCLYFEVSQLHFTQVWAEFGGQCNLGLIVFCIYTFNFHNIVYWRVLLPVCIPYTFFFSFETKDLTIMQLWLFWILLGRPHCPQTHRDLSASIAGALGWMVRAPHPRLIPDSSVRISWLCSHTSCEPRYFIGHCVFARRTLLSLLLHRSALRLKAGCCSALYRFC